MGALTQEKRGLETKVSELEAELKAAQKRV